MSKGKRERVETGIKWTPLPAGDRERRELRGGGGESDVVNGWRVRVGEEGARRGRGGGEEGAR